MSDMFQGLLACIGGALFFAGMLAAVRLIVRRSAFPYAEEEAGAPEGDQAHFRVAVDDATRAGEPTCAVQQR